MLNYIWVLMITIGIIIGILNGRVEEITKAVTDSSKDAVSLCISLCGIVCLWSGLMGVAKKSKLTDYIAIALKPITRVLFQDVKQDKKAMDAIVMNMVANFFGLGNAATPFGLQAMKELSRINNNRKTASNAMCMFLVINTCSIQLIPSSIIAIRTMEGAKNPTEIMASIWLTSVPAFVIGVILVKLFSLYYKD